MSQKSLVSEVKCTVYAAIGIVFFVMLACSFITGSDLSTPLPEQTELGDSSDQSTPSASQAGQGDPGKDCSEYFGKIIYSSLDKDQTREHREIFIADEDGSNAMQIARTDDDVLSYDDPAWSPDNCRIAVTGYTSVGGNAIGSIYTMDLDGSNLARLTDGQFQASEPAWSPDGKRIVYVSMRGGPPAIKHLYVMNADGSNQQLLFNQFDNVRQPEWSPDGKKILFEGQPYTNNQAHSRICVIDADGKNFQVLIASDDPHDGYMWPTWSPDGKQIALITNTFDHKSTTIGIMNADGSELRMLPYADPVPSLQSPHWSPDGRKIVVVDAAGMLGELFYEIATIDVESLEVVYLMKTRNIMEDKPDW